MTVRESNAGLDEGHESGRARGYGADGHEEETCVAKKSNVVKDNSPKTQINQDSTIWHTADRVVPRFS